MEKRKQEKIRRIKINTAYYLRGIFYSVIIGYNQI